MILMSQRNNVTIIDHISYAYSPVIEKIFFNRVESNPTCIYYEGKKVGYQAVSKEFKDFLLARGFQFRKSYKTYLRPRIEIFGIPISIQKNRDRKTHKIKEIVVIIRSTNNAEMIEKRKIIIEGINKLVPNLSIQVAEADKYVGCY